MSHRNAPLSETGRLRLARCVVEEGWTLRRAAERFQVAVTTAQRSTDLPEVETVQEAGFRGFEASAWYALAAPAGTPAEIIDRINTSTNALAKRARVSL